MCELRVSLRVIFTYTHSCSLHAVPVVLHVRAMVCVHHPLPLQVALLDAQLGALHNPTGAPLTFAEHPRPYLVLSAPLPAALEAASETSGSSVAGVDGEHLVGQVWVSGPLGRGPPGAAQRATLVVYPQQKVR